jgi:hypothetical protein
VTIIIEKEEKFEGNTIVIIIKKNICKKMEKNGG